ncbi:MAG: class I SAM-dependent DNA methyltransferase [Candidatus Heimdallarchaeota archaeon]
MELINKAKVKFSVDLDYYFRKYEDLSILEKRAIPLVRGDILDVGCATGYYVPALTHYGNVDAIDISEEAIEIAKEKGIKECHVADIFKYNPMIRYDTITLFENNIGLAGTLRKTNKMFRILAKLLKDEGYIIAIIRHIDYKKRFYSSKYKVVWKGKIRKGFRWFYFNINYLPKFFSKFDLEMEILDKDIDEGRTMYLIKIIHTNKS